MATYGIARSGDSIYDSIAEKHYKKTEQNVLVERDILITGNIYRETGTVFANSVLACTKYDKTYETDYYTLDGFTYYGEHINNTDGSIAVGSSTVFIGGIPVARVGDSVYNHANGTTSIKDGSNNVFVG